MEPEITRRVSITIHDQLDYSKQPWINYFEKYLTHSNTFTLYYAQPNSLKKDFGKNKSPKGVPPDKKSALNKLLETEIKEAMKKPLESMTGTDSKINETRTLLINDVLFQELNLAEHISRVHRQLRQKNDGMSKRKQKRINAGNKSRSKSMNKAKDKYLTKSEHMRSIGLKFKQSVETSSRSSVNFACCGVEESENFGLTRKLDGTLASDTDSCIEYTQELDGNINNSEKENEAVEIDHDVTDDSESDIGALKIDEDEHEEMEQCKGSFTSQSVLSKKKSHNKKKKQLFKKLFVTKLKSYSERWSTLRCSFCKKSFASEFYFNRHMQLAHPSGTDEKKIDLKLKKPEKSILDVCPICKKQFSDKYNLRTHIKTIHSESRVTYQCDLCGAVLKHKGSLGQHMKTVHTDVRPHKCHSCGKHFKVYQQLRNHERTHDPTYIDTCSLCGKKVRKGQLSIHMRRHGDDKKHECDTCGRRFFDKQDCVRHERIHSGEKPFKCSLCPYASANKGNLKSHLAFKHRDGSYDSKVPSPEKKYRIKIQNMDNDVKAEVDGIPENNYLQIQELAQDKTIIIISKPTIDSNRGENSLNPAYSILNSNNETSHASTASADNPTSMQVIKTEPQNKIITPHTTIVYNNETDSNAPSNSKIHQCNLGISQGQYSEQTQYSDLENSGQSSGSSVYHSLKPMLYPTDVVHETVNTSSEVPIAIPMQSADGPSNILTSQSHGQTVEQSHITTTQNSDQMVEQSDISITQSNDLVFKQSNLSTTQNNGQVVTIISYGSSGVK